VRRRRLAVEHEIGEALDLVEATAAEGHQQQHRHDPVEGHGDLAGGGQVVLQRA
jgi:hypothetical protein